MMEREPHLFDKDRYLSKENQLIKKSRETRLQYIKLNPDLSETQRLLIENGSIGEGLTKDQVTLIKDIKPDEVQETNKFGATEVWIYKQGLIKEFLYFKNSVLIKVEKT